MQYLYIGPDTVQSAQWHCMDSVCGSGTVKGTDVYKGFSAVSAEPGFLIGYLSVDSSRPRHHDYGGQNWWTQAKLELDFMWVALQ